jgi:NADPH:quinone reductase-like Zn-dependent oxidoreductase
MSTQSGLVVGGAGQPYALSSDLPKPKPGSKEILVKTLVVGVNPV